MPKANKKRLLVETASGKAKPDSISNGMTAPSVTGTLATSATGSAVLQIAIIMAHGELFTSIRKLCTLSLKTIFPLTLQMEGKRRYPCCQPLRRCRKDHGEHGPG